MGRLADHEKKQFVYKSIFLVGLALASVIFILSFGFKLIINGSLFINQFANRSKNSSEGLKTEQALTSLLVDPPPSATNSSTLLVTGSTVNFDAIEIYLNSEKVTDGFVVADSFTEEITGLEKGENIIYVIAKSKRTKNTKKSPEFTVLLKTDKPKLELSQPNDNWRTNKQDTKIEGKTDRETYIKINGKPVVVDSQGIFQTLFRLNEGDNSIEITAEDIVGNLEKKTVKVTYSKDD